MEKDLLAPLRKANHLQTFLQNLGFILVSNHCRRNCLHCPAYGDTSPVQHMSFDMICQVLTDIEHAYAQYHMAPARSIACWRISDPLDFFVRESGEKRTLWHVAQLWLRHLHQGLYVVTNGSEGKAFAREVLGSFVQNPAVISQIKLTVTSCDQHWGTDHYYTHILEDIRILSPLWNLPSLRVERPSDARFRINLKVTPQTKDETLAFMQRILADLGYSAEERDRLLQDPTRIAMKSIYDLSAAQNSPVIGAQSLLQNGHTRYKPTAERTRYQYGIYPDGQIFLADMYAFAELPATGPAGESLALAGYSS